MHPMRFPGESPDYRRARALRERVDGLRDARQRRGRDRARLASQGLQDVERLPRRGNPGHLRAE